MRTVTTPNPSQPPIEIHFGCDTLSSCPAVVRRTFRRGSLNRKVRGKPAGSSSAKQLVAYRFPGVAAASLNFQQGATAEGVGRGLPTVMLLQQVGCIGACFAGFPAKATEAISQRFALPSQNTLVTCPRNL